MTIPAQVLLNQSEVYLYFRVSEDKSDISFTNDFFEGSFSHIKPTKLEQIMTMRVMRCCYL